MARPIPSDVEDLLGYSDNCYEAAQEMVEDFAGLHVVVGFYCHNDYSSPHGWAEDDQGRIYDPNHFQFEMSEPELITEPGSELHRRYVATDGRCGATT